MGNGILICSRILRKSFGINKSESGGGRGGGGGGEIQFVSRWSRYGIAITLFFLKPNQMQFLEGERAN